MSGKPCAVSGDERLRALERIVPKSRVQAVLRKTGHAKRRYRRLPAWFMAYFLVALALFSEDSQPRVFKRLQRFRKGGTPARSTIAEARNGLGAAPMRLLAQSTVRLLGTPGTPGAFRKGLRLMALDSFVLDLPDTPANEKAFGRPGSGRGKGAFPQARVLALCEAGSHVLWRWQAKPCRRSEVAFAPVLLRHLEPDMLLMQDKAFLCCKHARLVRQRGAHLLARVKSCFVLRPEEELADGSFLSTLRPPSNAPRREREKGGVPVRVIEYVLRGTGHKDDGKPQRLLTTLLDHEEHPAEELVQLYHERWEEELAIDELKTHLLRRPVLRSRTPAGVAQEIDGLMLAHFAVRTLMQEAAASEGLDPDRVSFTGTLGVLRNRLPEAPRKEAGRAKLRKWWQGVVAEAAEELLPPRRRRVNARVIKKQASNWARKRACHRGPPKLAGPFKDSIAISRRADAPL